MIINGYTVEGITLHCKCDTQYQKTLDGENKPVYKDIKVNFYEVETYLDKTFNKRVINIYIDTCRYPNLKVKLK